MAKQQKFKIQVSKKYKPAERMAIAKEVIEFIRERTESGKDKNNRKFTPYSKEYKGSRDFKIAGKSKGLVDLTLTGEMLAELDVVSHRNGEITIGYDKEDSDLNGKVEGNRLGTYGKSKPVTKGRDFLGITDSDLKNILKKYPEKGEDKGKRARELLEASFAAGQVVEDTNIRNKG